VAHSGSTPLLGLPYPLQDDDVDVPTDIQALAEEVEKELGYAEVTSLPGSPVDGDKIILTNPATAPAESGRFRLQRKGGVWVYNGGTPAWCQKDAIAGAITASGAVFPPSDGAMQLTLTPGEWEIEWGCMFYRPVSSPAGTGACTQPQGAGLPTLGNPGAPNNECLLYFPGFGTGAGFGSFLEMSRKRRFTLTSAGGSVITEAYTAINGTIQPGHRWMSAIPVKL
jgi:hypothetical protein